MGVGVLFVVVVVFFIVFISTSPSASGWRRRSIVFRVALPVFFLLSIFVGCLGKEDHSPLGDDVPGRERGDDDERGCAPMHEPACIGTGRMIEDLTCACSCLDDELERWWWWQRRGQRWRSFLEGRAADDKGGQGGGEDRDDDGVGEEP